MSISESMTVWAGKPIVDWNEYAGITDPNGTAYRLRVEYDEDNEDTTWSVLLAAFLNDPRVGEVTALVVGNWDATFEQEESTPAVEALTAAADKLPNLTSLFFGDITSEESEISWIHQSDLSPLFNVFPNLEHFGVRGSEGLSLGVPRLLHLKTLVIECGGLPLSVIEEVFDAELPVLEHLELWLGDRGYGAEATIDDLHPLLGPDAAENWPHLRYLGLRDTELADAIAAAIPQSPLLSQLEVLDLSLGTLTDEGAEALAASPEVAHLKRLDIHHHFVSPEVVEKLKALGIEVNADETQTPDTYNGQENRYVAVGE